MKSLQNAVCITVLLFLCNTVNAQIPKLNSYPEATATIFLDFDGQTVTSPYWTGTSFYATPPSLTIDQIVSIFNRVAEDFRPFNLNITTDSTVFFAATPGKRQRLIITNYSEWYGSAGGVAYIPSFRWVNDVPGFVFSNLLSSNANPDINAKRVAEATSHEAGHTLGLHHQRIFDANCGLVSEYNPGIGSGETSWAPIMGVSYSRTLTLWHNGTSSSCNSTQDELGIISSNANGFGLRSDDIGASTRTAVNVIVSNNKFSTTGFINSSGDEDFFRYTLANSGRFSFLATPNDPNGLAGTLQNANIDLKADLLNDRGNVIASYTSAASLNAVIDTNLNAGTYFIKISSVGNNNVSNYGMLGDYYITGIVAGASVLPIHSLNLTARVVNEKHELEWNIIADEPIDLINVQVSTDGRNFTALQDVNGTLRSFVYQPMEKATLYYRLHITTASQLKYYSNIVSLSSVNGKGKYNLLTNLINSNSIVVISNGSYNWRLVDMNGRQLGNGRMTAGNNRIPANGLSSGMYLLQIIDGSEITTEKLVKY
jgi:hypothetical protein